MHMTDEKKKMTLLVIEDDVPELNALTDKFSREGFVVLQAHNGEEGLESALKNHPDVILLDIVMPKMDGITMLGKLRGDEWGQRVPVIVLTNLSDGEKISQSIEKGVYGYLVKAEWRLEEVVAKVKTKLGI